jgi:hypothetical protein
MIRRCVILVAGITGAVVLSSVAQSAPKVGEPVTVTACVYAGVGPGCLMLRGADGAVYNITGAKPRPPVGGSMIRLRGTVTDNLSMCAQGIVLDRIEWTVTKQKCPN